MKEEAITLLNAFIEETEMEDITETGIIIFLRWYMVLRVKWFIEEMFVTFLFAFTIITCWAKGFGLNLSGPIRVALCFGIIFLFTRFRMLASYKKRLRCYKNIHASCKQIPATLYLQGGEPKWLR